MDLRTFFLAFLRVNLIIGLSLAPITKSFASGGGDSDDPEIHGQPILAPANDSRINIALWLADSNKINLAIYSDYIDTVHLQYDENKRYTQETPAFSADDIINQLYPTPDDKQQYLQRTKEINSRYSYELDDALPIIMYWFKEANLPLEHRRILFDSLKGLESKNDQPELVDWFAYIKARDAFYNNDFALAKKYFTSLAQSNNAWIAETSTYNLIRVALRAAISADEYGFADHNKFNTAFADEALQAINHYLKTYPQGKYVASAEGLKRRVDWIKGDAPKIALNYLSVMAQMPKSNTDNITLLQEMDFYGVFFKDANGYRYIDDRNNNASIATNNFLWENSVLLTAQWLYNLRQGNHLDSNWKELLKTHAAKFSESEQKTLIPFLKVSAEFYQERNYAEVITATSHWEKLLNDKSIIATSTLVLRAFALEASGDFSSALKVLKALQKNRSFSPLNRYVEKAILANILWSDHLMDLFSKNNPIDNQSLRDEIIRSSATATELQKIMNLKTVTPHEKELAGYVLMQKLVAHGNYQDLYKTYMTNKAFYSTINIVTFGESSKSLCENNTETILKDLTQAQPKNISKLCISYWTLPSVPVTYDNSKIIASLGQPIDPNKFKSDGFTGTREEDMSIWQKVAADASLEPELRANMLHELLQCFYPTGYNRCPGNTEEIPTEQRKKWFVQLKTQFKNTSWAQQQKYYW